MARARTLGSGMARPVVGTWTVAPVPPGSVEHPSNLDALTLEWIPCDGPMPVAAVLAAAGRWSLDRPRDFDTEDWWYRCRFTTPDASGCQAIRFEGLATLADVWLNGTHILTSESMFVAHRVDVSGIVRRDNELTLCFHALAPRLAARQPRPRWRTQLVADQQLRWQRTALIGRMPSWCPPVAPVGPWRPILIEPRSPVQIACARILPSIDGDEGCVCATVVVGGGAANVSGTLAVGESGAAVERHERPDGGLRLHASVRLPRIERWWPHTHGAQPLYPVKLTLDADGERVDVDLGRIGFRTLEIDRGSDGDGFGLAVNGVAIFCRGACWTPLDIARVLASAGEYRTTLEQLRDAGMNMLRVAGPFVYEADAFYDLCDELGILVWHDFMFASMDYPSGDERFALLAAEEARQALDGLQARPALAVVCGNSEVEQQAAMLGLPSDRTRNRLFDETLPQLVSRIAPAAGWLRSTPSGGSLPFHADRGVAHYYGVGAYRRPLEDARRAGVRFAAECLGFSNVPDEDGLDAAGYPAREETRWKAGVPRDAAAAWDFEDVRDHYVELLFSVDAAALRAHDPARYLALGRVAAGEVMLRTMAEWRRPGSSCRGALVWFARDLRPGAGWGVLDSSGRPKSVYWYLKRALAPVALLAMDEGLNGLWLHAVNDTGAAIDAEIRVALYGNGRPRGQAVSASISIPARGSTSVHADALFDGFLDLTYAYRFGPPGHDVVAATMTDRRSGALLARAHCFPAALPARVDEELSVVARAVPGRAGFTLEIESNRFAHAVAIHADGFVPDDNYVHVAPGERLRVLMRRGTSDLPLRGTVRALNGSGPVAIGFETSIGRH